MNRNDHTRWWVAISAACAAALPAAGAVADNAEAEAGASASGSGGRDPVLEEVLVRAHPLSAEGLAQPFSVLQGSDLRRAQAASIGETLLGLPSVNVATFGQAVGRPVIRGLAGARVKVLEDRIDTLDVSVSSPDHAPTVDAFTAESIEVLMGPSTLLYGSGALGGVVDVHTGRIPHTLPETTTARIEARGADNGDRFTTAGRVDGGFGNFAVHVDGFYRDADDYDIPGFAESRRLRALEEEEHDDHDDDHDEDHEEEGHNEARGTLPGSFLETFGGALGLSYVGERGFVGLSVSRYESDYGLPGHSHDHGHEDEHEDDHDDEHEEDHHDEDEDHHGEEEGTAELNLEQTRVDFELGQRAPFSGFESINLRIGYNDYEHTEFEPDGASGTTFKSEAFEGRLELTHSAWAGVEGAFGLQASDREFSALGEEAFVEPVDTRSLGAFYVGQTSWGDLGLEGGLRLEQVDHDPDVGRSRDFSIFSASLGLIQPLSSAWTLTGQLDLSSRAPTAVELYSDGAHLATQSYESGDPNLDEEDAANISVGLRHQSDRWLFSANVFYTSFDGFIYEAATGEERDELPVLQWRQDDAYLYGGDAVVQYEAVRWGQGALSLRASADAVRARLDEGDDDNLPRIPPLRWSLGANLSWNNLFAELIYTRVEEQDNTAPLELVTDAFDDLRLHVSYAMNISDTRVEFFVNGTNLSDDEQRLHASYIKDLAPQPGRTLEAGVRVMLE